MVAHVAALIMLSIHSELVALRLFYPQTRKQNQGILRLTDCYLTSMPFPGQQSLPETVSYAHTPGLNPGKLPSNSDQVLMFFEHVRLTGQPGPHTNTRRPDPYSFEDQEGNFAESSPPPGWLPHVFP